jgi:hypothetical protein
LAVAIVLAPDAAAVELVEVVEVVEEVGAAAAVVADFELALELLALPHPATIKPAVASAATPAMRNLPVLRLAMVRSQVADCLCSPSVRRLPMKTPGASRTFRPARFWSAGGGRLRGCTLIRPFPGQGRRTGDQ